MNNFRKQAGTSIEFEPFEFQFPGSQRRDAARQAPQTSSFGTVEEANAANLPAGTVVEINGRRGVVE